MIKVLKPGLDVSVQDKGRDGHYQLSLPPSGAMDEYSFTIANLLIGNDENSAALEIAYLGPELEFQQDTYIAVTGGEMQPKINNQAVPMWESVKVKSGDILSFDFIKSGARSYLAVSGGFDVPIVMGSRSTYKSIGIGGFKGRNLQQGDLLKIGNNQKENVVVGNHLPEKYRPRFSKENEIRVVLGLCSYRFTDESIQRFFEIDWTVSTEADRVGYRLKGERLYFKDREQPFGAGSNPSNIVDSGYPLGSIQIPDGVEPIVLQKDAVTCGGFVTIGTVISTDLNRMAQIKTNEKIRFKPIAIDEAINERKVFYSTLEKIKSDL